MGVGAAIRILIPVAGYEWGGAAGWAGMVPALSLLCPRVQLRVSLAVTIGWRGGWMVNGRKEGSTHACR